MKILFLSQRFLLPMDTGAKIRTGQILKKLSVLHEITLVSNVERSKDDPWLSDIEDLCERFIPVFWKEVEKGSFHFFLRLMLQMFSPYPVSALNDYSRKLREALEYELKNKKYDLAICDFVQSALLFKNIVNIPTLLFQHNVEAMILKRHAVQANNPLTKLFWWLQWCKMSKLEKNACAHFDTVIAVSDIDRQFFQEKYGAKSVETIPTGVDVNYFCPQQEMKEEENSIVFCGSMDWLPNEDAVVYFIKEIFPRIKNVAPKANFTVVGKKPSKSIQNLMLHENIFKLTGWVEDTRPYIASSSVFIVPLRIGGGTRMKIYEAMAMGKAVVSTTIGAEGLPVENNKHLLLADTPEQFAEQTLRLFQDADLRRRLGISARNYVIKNFSWQSVAKKFSEICEKTTENY